jgi:hypothetical protein
VQIFNVSINPLAVLAAVLVGVALVGGGAAAGTSESFEVIEAYVGGGQPGQQLPLIIVLHSEDSDQGEALALLEGLQKPARVLVPLGRVPTPGGRHSYYGLELSGEAYFKAQRDEALRLANWLPGVVGGAVPPRCIVIGLGASGPLACALAMGLPLLVRQAYGTGGVVPSAWVPLSPGQLGNLQRPVIRKMSFGAAVPIENVTQKLAQSRGFNFDTITFFSPPSQAAVTKWLLPQVSELLDTP